MKLYSIGYRNQYGDFFSADSPQPINLRDREAAYRMARSMGLYVCIDRYEAAEDQFPIETKIVKPRSKKA